MTLNWYSSPMLSMKRQIPPILFSSGMRPILKMYPLSLSREKAMSKRITNESANAFRRGIFMLVRSSMGYSEPRKWSPCPTAVQHEMNARITRMAFIFMADKGIIFQWLTQNIF